MKIGAISIKVFFNKPNTLKIYFLGTKEFLYELRVRVSHALQIKEKKVKKVKSISRLHYYGDDARKVCFWLYQEAEGLYLPRKYIRFKNHIEKRKQQWNLSK